MKLYIISITFGGRPFTVASSDKLLNLLFYLQSLEGYKFDCDLTANIYPLKLTFAQPKIWCNLCWSNAVTGNIIRGYVKYSAAPSSDLTNNAKLNPSLYGKLSVIRSLVSGPKDRYPDPPKVTYKQVTQKMVQTNNFLNELLRCSGTACSRVKIIPAPWKDIKIRI